MRIEKDASKERINLGKHKLDFSFAEHVFTSPLAITVYDRFEGGEHRWHTFAHVGTKLLLVVHSYPDPGDETWIRVIGVREATPAERTRYEESDLGD